MTGSEPQRAGWSAVPGGELRATKLLRVIPVAQACAVETGELTIASIEIYEDGCLLRCHLIPFEHTPPTFEPGRGQWYRRRTVAFTPETRGAEDAPPPPRERFPDAPQLPDDYFRLSLEDDAGTRYAGMSRGGGGDNVRWETTYGFVPAIAQAATTLRIVVQGSPSRPAFTPICVLEVRL